MPRVQLTVAPAERIPFDDATFDTVCAAMILCTVRDPAVVLKEIERVLKPGGQYLFLEHVRNPNPAVARRQDRIQPCWFVFGNECHCNRPTVETLQGSSLEVVDLARDQIPGARQFIEAMVIGRAVRRSPVPDRAADVVSQREPGCGCPDATHDSAMDRASVSG